MQGDYDRDPRTARSILEDRRYAEFEIDAIRRQIDKEFVSPVRVGSGLPAREKVPGKDEWIVRPRGTNNAIGAALQHVDGYTEALERVIFERRGLMQLAEDVLMHVKDTIDRTILRYYYCQAMSDDEIAPLLNYDRRSICRRRNESMDALEIEWAKVVHNIHNCPRTSTQPVV